MTITANRLHNVEYQRHPIELNSRRRSANICQLLLATLLLGACGGSTTLVSTPINETPTSSTQAAEDRSSSDSNGGGQSVDSGFGSRAQAAPIGSVILIQDAGGKSLWEVTLLESNLNVNTVIAKENMFNPPPPDGFQFAGATVSVTYLGSDRALPGSDLTIAFVSAAGTTHKTFDVLAVGPQDLSDVNELYTNGTAIASVYIAVPTLNADKGTWRISAFLNDSEFYFSAS